MPERNLHVIAFDVPFPANYGGVVDIFYKIKALHGLGVKIKLHCFVYGRDEADELKEYCEEVHYYDRKVSKRFLFNSLPYITKTRRSDRLMTNLLKDNDPILFEGLHCCAYLDDSRLWRRKKLVRMHNIEHDYYNSLAENELNIFRKYYFFNEANKLKKFESVLESATDILAISNADYDYLSGIFPNVQKVSAFHPNDKVEIKTGKGDFALYHGNLSVNENDGAAQYLVNNIFNDIDVPLIIAGNKPSDQLRAAVAKHENCSLVDNADTEKIHSLIENAQINVLPTFQATGIKLKLLMALYTGRHCVVNTPMVANTGLETLCAVCDGDESMKTEIKDLFNQPFAGSSLERETILSNGFSNEYNAIRLLHLLD
ncbi:MAG: glycosyltransferase [Flavobacteriales bacterium]|nr:glycosyltransferase [Flavobacteriales bacterium]